MQPFTNAIYAFDKEDKFLETPWYAHIEIFGAGAANGLLVAGFEGWGKDELRKLDLSKTNSIIAGSDFATRSLGTFAEFTLSSYAKYGKSKWTGFADKAGKGGLKNFGYLFTTYF